jgi:hypothetical protein
VQSNIGLAIIFNGLLQLDDSLHISLILQSLGYWPDAKIRLRVMMSFSKHILFGRDSTLSRKILIWFGRLSDAKLASPGWVLSNVESFKAKMTAFSN